MENIKDTQGKKDALYILDIQKEHIPAFGQNVTGDRIYRRIERLVSAIYLVTKHVPADESVRVRLRHCGTLALQNVLLIKDNLRSKEAQSVEMLFQGLQEMDSLIRLLCVAGFISSQNAEMLLNVIQEIVSLIVAARRSPLSENILLRKEFFVHQESEKGSDYRADTAAKQSVLAMNQSKPQTGASGPSVRGERVVAILTTGNRPMSIKDISSQLPEYSEKMIQRELLALVAGNRVKKSGNKRWSRYFV